MDRLNQLKGEAGGSRDSTLDTSSPPSEAFMTANESSKYFSLSEDSEFDISSIKDVSLSTADSERTVTDDQLISNLSPIGKSADLLDSYKIGKQIEAANILSGGVDIFDDNDNSNDGNDLIIDDNVDDEKSNELMLVDTAEFKGDEDTLENVTETDTPSKDTEVVLQIDGKNVDAIDIGNGLYLYRKEGEEELAAVQIIDDDQQQPSFKFLKVRENAEGNLEVYEEIQIEVPKEVPAKEGKSTDKNITHVPIKDISKVISEPAGNVTEKTNKIPLTEVLATPPKELEADSNKYLQSEFKEVNFNTKIKISEARKSPVIGTFTPMTYHSTPNKEGKPLTKTMVDLQLHPSRHSDNVKKTIEVHTDNSKQKTSESGKNVKEVNESKSPESKFELKEYQEKDSSEQKVKESEVPIENKPIVEDKVAVIAETNNKKTEAIKIDTPVIDVPKEIITVEKTDDSKEDDKKEKVSESGVKYTVTDYTPSQSHLEDKVAEVIPSNTILKKTTEASARKIDENTDIVSSSTEKKVGSSSLPVYSNKDDKIQQHEKDTIREVRANQDKVKKDQVSSSQEVKNSEKTKSVNIESGINVDERCDDQILEKTKSEIIKSGKNVDQQSVNQSTEKIKSLDIELSINVDQKSVNQSPEKIKSLDIESSKNVDQKSVNQTSENIKNKDIESGKNFDKSNSPVIIEQVNEEKTDAEDLKEKKPKVSCTKSDLLKPEQNVCKETSVTEQTIKTQAAVSTEKPIEPECMAEKTKGENNKPETAIELNCKKTVLVTLPVHSKPEVLANTKTLEKKTEEPTRVVTEAKPNLELVDKSNKNKDVKSAEVNKVAAPSTDIDKKEIPKINNPAPVKPINNNHAAVPFGKWTEANRQDFLNKIKESKVPTNHSNGKQIKNSNDLNRRDILKKIDTQRSNIATAKAQEMANIAKLGQGVKKEAPIFMNKSSVCQDTKIPLKSEAQDVKTKPAIISKKPTKQETVSNTVPEIPTATVSAANSVKSERRTEINYQDLIDKTIDDIIGKAVTIKDQEDTNENVVKESAPKSKREEKPQPVEKHKVNEKKTIERPLPVHRPKPIEKPKPTEKLKQVEQPKPVVKQSVTKSGMNTLLDNIEMEMNKLHGIPFVERPQHELPQVVKRQPFRTYGKAESDKAAEKHSKVPKLLPFVNKGQQKLIKDNTIDLDSEEEIIEHEPITGDIEINKKEIITKSTTAPISMPSTTSNADSSKKEAIITENDFDKFARRNSKTYENCLKVNFDGSETHNVIQTVVEKDNIKMGSKVETVETKFAQKHDLINIKPAKVQSTMFSDNDHNKHYPSKVKMAYQSVMTAKRQLERPITIIEDKPVKVMYVDSNMDFFPNTLNVQGNELAPPRIHIPEIDTNAASSCDSLDSEVSTVDDAKSQDEIKLKTKHQRKQVLTPVETPDLELIEPEDLGFVVSPKKKRRTEENRVEKSPKALVPKKSYLLGRNTEDKAKAQDLSQSSFKESVKQEDPPKTHNAASAIDSLVKAAALIETQSENVLKNVANSPVTPIKRGRGRPRKYPLPEGEADKVKAPSPQKKPRLIDAKVKKPDIISDDDSSDDEIIKENWTMGKINENIVCPICSKLFRSENVVFKHVKHCTGPSPNRSDSDKRSPRRGRFSQESESNDSKMTDETDFEVEKSVPKKRKSKESPPKPAAEKYDVIVIEDTPIKEKPVKREVKTHDTKKAVKNKIPDKVNSLICEICGKTFRQLSYLVTHKLQHNKDEQKKMEPTQVQSKSVFSCEVCKKEFRKLHHLVQHRIIHNPNAMPARMSRKSSSEQKDNKVDKDKVSKQNEDPSAGFRCEPCDKSFRKLHHLVEHRETHDGINRQKNAPVPPVNEKLPPPPQCDVCNKTFRKLHHLIEHKEQHLETSSEKSDDKSVKSSLSTKDIIHECSLCYMVFPNEHSLTKHTVICQRKKKQSAAKALKQAEDSSNTEKEHKDENISEASQQDDDIKEIEEIATEKIVIPILRPEPVRKSTETKIISSPEQKSRLTLEADKPQLIALKESEKETITKEPTPKPLKEAKQIESASKLQVDPEIPAKIPKTEEKETGKTPKKKTPVKEKSATVTKRQKSINAPLPVVDEVKPADSSDDDEVRYMLNPDFKVEETTEAKLFMKVKAKKRNSLQIERPNSKDLVKRRISLQHPPKIPRLKPKAVEAKVVPVAPVKNTPKPNLDPAPSTDSDDSDVKYSFPKTTIEKTKPAPQETAKEAKITPRKSLADKRKSLGGIAKRKSMGKAIIAKHKAKPSPVKTVKRRTAEVDYRCDCGQLFSSAALLARHTLAAHTPPRVRRRRSPARSDTALKDKSSIKSSEKSAISEPNRKSMKAEETAKKNASGTKVRRSAAHRGVPVPEKMRKLMEKMK